MTLANTIAILAQGLSAWTRPLRAGLVFGGLLLWGTFVAGQVSGLLGLVSFIIYVGGALVLFSYCFMLTPRLDTQGGDARLMIIGLLVAGSCVPVASGLVYEFYWSSGLTLCVGALLFLVMMSVVALVDLTGGSVRPAVE